jgi:MOSC domain-containing protein YiiM
MSANVISVSARDGHGLGKTVQSDIILVTYQGVLGDAHCGVTVKHRSRVAKDPTRPNLRQVHLIHSELLDELAGKGFHVSPGELGENILTAGIELLDLPTGALLNIGPDVVVQIEGLRNPCNQINGHSPQLMDAMLDRATDGALVRKAGIMGTVLAGGRVSIGDGILITKPGGPHIALMPV